MQSANVSPPASSNLIGYEYPLSERVRTLLRLEDLYKKALYFASKTEPAENHIALVLLFDILEVAGRADLKSDLLQELERQRHMLEGLRGNPAISVDALDQLMTEIDQTSTRLFQMTGKFGQDLRENEWLMGIKQRTSIPGGVCEFDLPSYHYWLNQSAQARQRDIETWLAPFRPIYDAIAIVLRLLRESGKSTSHVASQGVFQMAGRVAQMVRVRLAREYACVPEISANKYALNIRFMTLTGPGRERPRTADSDVQFELTFCNL